MKLAFAAGASESGARQRCNDTHRLRDRNGSSGNSAATTPTGDLPHPYPSFRVRQATDRRSASSFDGANLHSSKPKPPSSARDVPAVVVSRLSLYLRELQHLVRAGRATVSSSQLATLFGFTDAQVRKDLAYFGHFGHPGIGYRCDELIAEIRRILGTDRQWTVTMVGVGNMGRALLRYKGFSTQGFRIVEIGRAHV